MSVSVSQIKEGSRVVNEKLKNRGFLKSSLPNQLLFCSLDLEKLLENDESDKENLNNNESDKISAAVNSSKQTQTAKVTQVTQVTQAMLLNDKKVLNVIYELLNLLEKTAETKEIAISQHNQQREEINKLKKQNGFLINEVISKKDKIIDEKDMEILKLKKSIHALNNDIKYLKKERSHLKILNDNTRENSKIEIKKKDVIIDELRDKLLLKLNSPSQYNYNYINNNNQNNNQNSISSAFPKNTQQEQTVTTALGPPSRLINNTTVVPDLQAPAQAPAQMQAAAMMAPQPQQPLPLPKIAKSDALSEDDVLVKNIIDRETRTLLEDSSNLLFQLINNNEESAAFLTTLAAYFDQLYHYLKSVFIINQSSNGTANNNSQILVEYLPTLNDFITQFNDNLQKSKSFNNIDLTKATNSLSNFDSIKSLFYTNFEKFYNLISNVENTNNKLEFQNGNNKIDHYKLENEKLLKELNQMKENCKKANLTVEKWKFLYKSNISSNGETNSNV
ncbi:hypothetical protein PACTADRAFT_50487 [Pachysolen tannophilus NRRL Y-2460]|uniref:Uncharacterized protein n=1 Tax=Pachysolen tannophilus NRRL Y-2460 TaxID=669874 RepID=A0A1E4TS93_PACTA|nr:hypothetical protein PACTADRAFT_50487 [Pachysolen tannophilus NRRL Y-2460]